MATKEEHLAVLNAKLKEANARLSKYVTKTETISKKINDIKVLIANAKDDPPKQKPVKDEDL